MRPARAALGGGREQFEPVGRDHASALFAAAVTAVVAAFESNRKIVEQWRAQSAGRPLPSMTELAIDIDTVVRLTKPDSWIGNPFEERMVKRAIAKALPTDFDRLDKLFNLVKAP